MGHIGDGVGIEEDVAHPGVGFVPEPGAGVIFARIGLILNAETCLKMR
jgi:hypothetical protein